LSIRTLVAKIQPYKVVRWCANGDFLGPAFSTSCVPHVSDLHFKFALRPHSVWQYGRHPICDGWDQARKKKEQQQQPFNGPLSGTTGVIRYQKKHWPTHHPDHYLIFISFFHVPRSIASSLFKLHAWQSFCTTSYHVLFGLPLGLEPSTSYSIHFFKQSVSSFRSPCPYHRSLFYYSIMPNPI